MCLQSQVQNMMTSKYIAFFHTEVSEWQRKLSTADQVISTYMEVQRTWCHLESIFIGSEDIRNQLPEDSERFDMIDAKFKVWLWKVFSAILFLTVHDSVVRKSVKFLLKRLLTANDTFVLVVTFEILSCPYLNSFHEMWKGAQNTSYNISLFT